MLLEGRQVRGGWSSNSAGLGFRREVYVEGLGCESYASVQLEDSSEERVSRSLGRVNDHSHGASPLLIKFFRISAAAAALEDKNCDCRDKKFYNHG